MLELDAITLANFQALRDPCTIPIKPLTLLFGPNSAGKSAIHDAIALARDTWGEAGHQNWKSIYPRLDRWRHTSQRNLPDSEATVIRVDLTSYDLSRWDFSEDQSAAFISDCLMLDYVEIYDYFTEHERKISAVIRFFGSGSTCFEYLVDGELAFSYYDDQDGFGPLTVEFSHPLFRESGVFDLVSTKSARYQEIIKQDRFTFATEGGPGQGRSIFWGALRDNSDDDVFRFIQDMGSFFNQALSDAVSISLRSGYVEGNRTIPDHADLLFYYRFNNRLIDSRLISAEDRCMLTNHYLEDLDSLSEVLTHRLGRKDLARHFEALAKDGLASLLHSLIANTKLSEEIALEPKGKFGRGQLWDNVNHSLATHLFAEKGYQLSIETRLVSYNQTSALLESGPLATETIVEILNGGSLVLLGLKESSGKRIRMDDVGSGIGYAVPVLAAGWGSRLSFIEQPELHLHPALQSELGDAFIEMAGDGRKLVIETHSEHLILRLLRRIRDNSRGRQIPAELRLKPDDVHVLYFDPQLDGSTKIKHLRVSPAGEFMDRWPRGFFTEREADLFDE
jgi:hypothetical protein